METLLVVLPIVIGALTLLYLTLYGQRSIAEYRREKRQQIRAEGSAQSRIQVENLPAPDYVQFVGREDEVAELQRLLLPYPRSQHSVIAIDGIGGAGKSALALHVAREYVRRDAELPADERFDAVIWTSAKEAILTGTGTETRPWPERTLDEICETIAGCLRREDITRVPSERRLEPVRNAMKAQRTLLVIDNMEAVDDERVYAFLRELPAPTKALITTRTRLDVAMTIHLGGLAVTDAAKVFRALLTEADSAPDDHSTQRLAEQTGGLPLAMVWAAARMRLGDTLDDVLSEMRDESDEMLTDYSFGAIWTRLSQNPSWLAALRVAAMAPAPVTAELVAGATGAPDVRTARSALNELVRSCVLTRRGNMWEIHPLVRVSTARRARNGEAGYLSAASAAMAARLRELIGDERVGSVSVDQYGLVDPDRENILFLVEWSFRAQLWEKTRDLVAGLGYYLHARGLWTNAVRVWEMGAIAAEECGDRAFEARFRAYLGYMAYFMGDVTRARFHHTQATKLVDPDSETYQRASLIRLAGYLARDTGDLEQALRLFGEALEIMTTCRNTHGICRVTNDIAETRIKLGQLDAADTDAQTALARADAGGELIERVRAITVLAAVARQRGTHTQAAVYAEQARSEALTSGWWEDAGKATLELARAARASHDRSRALDLVGEAQDYYDRIGNVRGIGECSELAEELSKKDWRRRA